MSVSAPVAAAPSAGPELAPGTSTLRGRDLLSIADLTAAELAALLDRAAALKAEWAAHAEPPRAAARRARRGAPLPEAQPAHTGLVRAGGPAARRPLDLPVRRGRGPGPPRERRRHRPHARPLGGRARGAHLRPCHARGAGIGHDRAGHQRPERSRAPLPVAGGPAHAPGTVRASRGSDRRVRRRGQQRLPLAGHRVCGAGRPRPPGVPARLRAGPVDHGHGACSQPGVRGPAPHDPRPAHRGRRGGRGLRRYLGLHGQRGPGRRPAARLRQLPRRCRAHGRRLARRDLHALPARSPRRRGDRRRHRRPAQPRLRPGREPPPRPEGLPRGCPRAAA